MSLQDLYYFPRLINLCVRRAMRGAWAWQQHCMDVNKRNHNERKATRLPHEIPFTMETDHNKKAF